MRSGWVLLVMGCASEPDVPEFDAEAPPIACATGSDAPLLDEALQDAGLAADDVGYTETTWAAASYAPFLDDRFLLGWFRDVHWRPLALQCHTGQIAADLDHAATTAHPVSTALGEAMARLDVDPGLTPIVDPVVEPLPDVPEELQAALDPILVALQRVADAREALAQTAPASDRVLVEHGHIGMHIDTEAWPDLGSDAELRWVKRQVPALFDPARILAFAIEDADLGRFEGLDLAGTWSLPFGDVVIAGPGRDEPGRNTRAALYLDLGGDDVYLHSVGASSARLPVSVHIDLGGDDVYGYPTTDDGTDGVLPADADGRYSGAGAGPVSLSTEGRQGSGRFGVGMLFDLGGSDRYTSLRMSQGYGHLGVGVLFDAKGDDTYALEAGGQGAGVMGIGLLMDVRGTDEYRTFVKAQGFGGPRGVGIAWDGGGDDIWFADPGQPEAGGVSLYPSAQRPDDSNASFAQGAGFGVRRDDLGVFLSGGLGVLRDRSGDDTYTASIFAQGTGYWQAAGYLLDGAGADRYDALWYVQGGAAHYAIGALMDDGDGDDRLNQNLVPINVHTGSGHDFSVGLYVNEAGDDVVRLAGLAGGASNCQGVGIAVDNDGRDVWEALQERAIGLGNQSTECNDPVRTRAPSVGLFLDSGGDADEYTFPESEHPRPADDAAFGWAMHGADDEFGGAVDGDGATALHASGVR